MPIVDSPAPFVACTTKKTAALLCALPCMKKDTHMSPFSHELYWSMAFKGRRSSFPCVNPACKIEKIVTNYVSCNSDN